MGTAMTPGALVAVRCGPVGLYPGIWTVESVRAGVALISPPPRHEQRYAQGKCRGCRLRVDYDGRGYCTDAKTDWKCLREQSAAAVAAQEAVDEEFQGGENMVYGGGTPSPGSGPDASPGKSGRAAYEAARLAREAQREAETAAILEALPGLPAERLLPILLWYFWRREFQMTAREGSDAPKPERIAEKLAGPKAAQFLSCGLSDLLGRSMGETDRKVIGEFIGLAASEL